ncbi:MAG: heparinase II/III family protein, partial [Calditrichia bacterium]
MNRPLNRLIILFLTLFFTAAGGQPASTGTRNADDLLQNAAGYLLKGVLYGRYKKPGWREFIMPDRLELPIARQFSAGKRPRLLSQNSIRLARARRLQKIYREWYRLILQEAQSPLPPDNFRVSALAGRAKAAAFLYRVEERGHWRRRALELLEMLPEPPQIINLEGGPAGRDWGDYLQSAEALPDLCVAYDLLADEIPGDLRFEVERKILRVAAQLAEGFNVTPRNNHVTVMSFAVATAALVIDQPERYIHYTSAGLFRTAMEHLSLSLGLISPDGGYGEGPYYARYVLNYLASFSLHLQEAAGADLFNHPYLERLVNWVMDNDKGSGQFTQFDDAYSTRFFFLPLLIPQCSSGVRWEKWFRQQASYPQYSSNMVEALLYYRPAGAALAENPFFAAEFYPDMGQAVFRDRDVSPDFFVSLTGERERWFADVHEQIDPLSLEISALGEDWIIDGGYGGGTDDPDYQYFQSPQSASTMLVDGRGTDPNPLIGDPPGATLEFAFATARFAAAAFSHFIDDAKLTRTVFYTGENRLLLLDAMEAESPHELSLQFQHLGRLNNRGAGEWEFQKADKKMTVYWLNDQPDLWRTVYDRGLATGAGTIFEHGVVSLQSAVRPRVQTAALWQAEQKKNPAAVIYQTPVKGEGEWRQMIHPQNGSTEEVVWNCRDTISTGLWSSDARLIWSQSAPGGELQQLLMVRGSFFRQGNIEIKTSGKVTLYLERQGTNWGGYLQLEENSRPLLLQVRGLNNYPLRLNGLPVAGNSLQTGGAEYWVHQSGTLLFGGGSFLIRTPQQHLPAPDFLYWLRRMPDIRQNSAYWSPYEQTLFENQVTENLLWGAGEAAEYWGERLSGDSLVLIHGLNALQGLLAYNYRASLEGRGFALPHRYGWRGNAGSRKWQIREEGDWRGSGPYIRHLQINGEVAAQLALDYRFQHLYGDYYRQNLGLQMGAATRLYADLVNTGERQLQQYGFLAYGHNRYLSPNLLLRDGRLSALEVSGGRNSLQGAFSASNLQSAGEYRQLLRGKAGQRYRWLLQGYQNNGSLRQSYRGAFAGSAGEYLRFSSSAGLEYTGEKWQTGLLALEISNHYRQLYIFQQLHYLYRKWSWSGGLSGSAGEGYWSAEMSLWEQPLARRNRAALQAGLPLGQQAWWTFRAEYLYLPLRDERRIQVEQQWQVQ